MGRGGRRLSLAARPVDRSDALAAVLAGLPAEPRMLEVMHAVIWSHGELDEGWLTALARWSGRSMADLHGVATFYERLEHGSGRAVVPGADTAPHPAQVRVCDGLSCRLAGGEAAHAALAAAAPEGTDVVAASCLGLCDAAPAAVHEDRPLTRLSAEGAAAALAEDPEEGRRTLHAALRVAARASPSVWLQETFESTLSPTADRGAHEVFDAVASHLGEGGEAAADEVCEALRAAGLPGLGGAGFPTGLKWRFVREAVAARGEPGVLCVNADEGEPGTGKDRWVLTEHPERLLEGIRIACATLGLAEAWVYLRQEYRDFAGVLQAGIDAGLDSGWFSERGAEGASSRRPSVLIHLGAGAYICGEETALLESLEGKRGEPRLKPPFPAQHGLDGRPTLVNNVETLAWVPEVLGRGLLRGALSAAGHPWYAAQGAWTPRRLYTISGDVARAGISLRLLATTLGEFLDDAGGLTDGDGSSLGPERLRAIVPGGISAGFLGPEHLTTEASFTALAAVGSMGGSGGVILIADRADRADDALLLAAEALRFFARESCGQCTPCRLGTLQSHDLLHAWRDGTRAGDSASEAALWADLELTMQQASICGLGQAAPLAVSSARRLAGLARPEADA